VPASYLTSNSETRLGPL